METTTPNKVRITVLKKPSIKTSSKPTPRATTGSPKASTTTSKRSRNSSPKATCPKASATGPRPTYKNMS
jgi:hypothetical protein